MKYCQAGDKAIVSYLYEDEQQRYETKKTPVEIEIEEPPEDELRDQIIKFGTSATVPENWLLGAEVFLYGTGYTAPDYPNCPSDYVEDSIGVAKPNQTLTVVHRSYPDGCVNANFADVPELDFFSDIRQWPGASAKIGLKKILDVKCTIKITDSSGKVFTDDIDCGSDYEVDCGNCPKGHLKCKSSKYPGYCCLPCKETANKIRALGNKL